MTSLDNPPVYDTPRDPWSTTLLHEILPLHRPTLYSLGLRHQHWYLLLCHDNCNHHHCITNMPRKAQFCQHERRHWHWKFLSFSPFPTWFDSNLPIQSNSFFTNPIWLPLHAFYFWFKSHHPGPIRFMSQRALKRLECAENSSKVKSWNILKFWELKLFLVSLL